MYKLLSVLLVVGFTVGMMPATNGAESASRDYIGGLGVLVMGQGRSLILCYDPTVPPCSTLGMNVGLGGTDLTTVGFYANAIVSLSDDLYGSEAANRPCFYHPDGDTICAVDGDDGVSDYPGAAACGTQALLGAPFLSNFVSLFVYDVLVTEDLDVCGATTGTATADLF